MALLNPTAEVLGMVLGVIAMIGSICLIIFREFIAKNFRLGPPTRIGTRNSGILYDLGAQFQATEKRKKRVIRMGVTLFIIFLLYFLGNLVNFIAS